jgi:hypothetical protein
MFGLIFLCPGTSDVKPEDENKKVPHSFCSESIEKVAVSGVPFS